MTDWSTCQDIAEDWTACQAAPATEWVGCSAAAAERVVLHDTFDGTSFYVVDNPPNVGGPWLETGTVGRIREYLGTAAQYGSSDGWVFVTDFPKEAQLKRKITARLGLRIRTNTGTLISDAVVFWDWDGSSQSTIWQKWLDFYIYQNGAASTRQLVLHCGAVTVFTITTFTTDTVWVDVALEESEDNTWELTAVYEGTTYNATLPAVAGATGNRFGLWMSNLNGNEYPRFCEEIKAEYVL